jgi:transcriptional regulator with XRE-family HTH domain
MMATISDVAREAGVSISTVSYVLSGKRTISTQTRDRVESGFGMAVAPASVSRLYGQGAYRFVPLEGVADSRVVLVSAVDRSTDLVRAIHREAADVVRLLSPLVLGGGSAAVDEVVSAAMQL